MTNRIIWYWVTTGLLAVALGAGGLLDLLGAADVLSALAHLGYPAYVAVILGGWKLLGVAAIVTPGLPCLKEWAYAGMFFDLTGASVSHAVLEDGASAVLTPLALVALVIASWALRPEGRKLAARPARPASPFSTAPTVLGGAR